MARASLSLCIGLLAGIPAATCHRDPAPRPATPGPIELTSIAQVQDFLTSGRFAGVLDRSDWWSFDANGEFEARIGDEHLSGNWSATESRLSLQNLRVRDGTAEPYTKGDQDLELKWLDGKRNIQIAGLQYRKY